MCRACAAHAPDHAQMAVAETKVLASRAAALKARPVAVALEQVEAMRLPEDLAGALAARHTTPHSTTARHIATPRICPPAAPLTRQLLPARR